MRQKRRRLQQVLVVGDMIYIRTSQHHHTSRSQKGSIITPLGLLLDPIIGVEGSVITMAEGVLREESLYPYIHGANSVVRDGPKRDQFLGISMTHYVYCIDQGRSHTCVVITTTKYGYMYRTVVLTYVGLSSSTGGVHFLWGVGSGATSCQGHHPNQVASSSWHFHPVQIATFGHLWVQCSLTCATADFPRCSRDVEGREFEPPE